MEQNEREFTALLDLLRSYRLPSILEVGVFQGGTLLRFAHAFPDARVVGIDPRPMLDPAYANEPYRDGRYSIVHGCSQDPMVRQRARSLNDGENFAFAFIDGDHTYEGVREDWEWAKRECRIVAFHDIHSTHTCPGVVKFWEELSRDFRQWDRRIELSEPTEQEAGRNGIGVVWPYHP